MNKLDLHGFKIHNAWKEFTRHITECYFGNIKQTTIITGQGKIAEEILAWVRANQYCKTAERNDNNSGAVVVHIRKNKDNQKASTIEKPKVDLSPLLKKFGSY
tara:strand:+ start:1332 stop:1640 length:309 start_codon:yes stop_codon:yes gene_type:complete